MEGLVTAILASGWPWLILLLGVAVGLYYVSKALPSLKETLWTPLVSWLSHASKRERERVDAELADLRRQVEYLTRQVSELRVRDELYWEYVLHVQEVQRRRELLAAENGWELPEHRPFIDFREDWLTSHENYKPLAP